MLKDAMHQREHQYQHDMTKYIPQRCYGIHLTYPEMCTGYTSATPAPLERSCAQVGDGPLTREQ